MAATIYFVTSPIHRSRPPKKQRIIALWVAGLFALLSSVGYADPFDDGLSAYRRNDFATAFQVWRALAENGDAHAQVYLGLLYLNGQGAPQNPTLAVMWYRKAADQGNAAAQHNLGWAYEHGRGTPQDFAQAVAWYRKAAEKGNRDAQISLGRAYEAGHGVEQDFEEAVEWYRKAATKGTRGGR